MAEKEYILEVVRRARKARSKRLRGSGNAGGGGSVVGGSTVVEVNGQTLVGETHSHENKSTLDKLHSDDSDYLYIEQLREVEQAGGGTAWESQRQKAKAGYADESGHSAESDHSTESDHSAESDHSLVSDDSVRWEGERMADWLDQPVRKNDNVEFRDVKAKGNVKVSGYIGSPEFMSDLFAGFGWRIDSNGAGELNSLKVRTFFEVLMMIVNRLQGQEGDTVFSDNDQIEAVELDESWTDEGVAYILTLKEKWEGYFTAQQYGNIVKGIINTLAANAGGISDVDAAACVESDGVNKYYTSFMRVVGDRNTDPELGNNQIKVVLYGDAETPAGKNFPPCELMTICRCGCWQDADAEGLSEDERELIRRRQRFFYLSSSTGRFMKLTGVNSPKLDTWNYGTVLGEVPDFVKNWRIANRLISGRDYLYAQGVIVGDFIKVDFEGKPLVVYVDNGEWVDGGEIQAPSVGHGIYLVNEKNDQSLQWETHDVWHNGLRWRCLQHQPVVIDGVPHYYEPQFGSAYWQVVEGDTTFKVDFQEPYDLYDPDNFQGSLTLIAKWGQEDVTRKLLEQDIVWTRYSEDSHGVERVSSDNAWNILHNYSNWGRDRYRLVLSDEDLDAASDWPRKISFRCDVVLRDGKGDAVANDSIIIGN